ncbi:MAG: hypothetical protein V4550_05945 [Gemmatimonadota bacterium]
MFDQEYFDVILQRDVDAVGGQPVVEIQLMSGHSHRVLAIVSANSHTVTLDAYQARGDLSHERSRFADANRPGGGEPTYRAVIAYESIAAVVLDPAISNVKARPGFAST